MSGVPFARLPTPPALPGQQMELLEGTVIQPADSTVMDPLMAPLLQADPLV
jgi:hypothetical protein